MFRLIRRRLWPRLGLRMREAVVALSLRPMVAVLRVFGSW
jgi:hypothetical protein